MAQEKEMFTNGNGKMTWSGFVKLLTVAGALVAMIIGGMQFYFMKMNNLSERLVSVEQEIKTIQDNHLEHLNNKVKNIKDCQDEQGKKIQSIDSNVAKILERIKYLRKNQ